MTRAYFSIGIIFFFFLTCENASFSPLDYVCVWGMEVHLAYV